MTGGGDGIGGATARRLAEEGASVLIVEVTDLGEENAAAIRDAGGPHCKLLAIVHVDTGVEFCNSIQFSRCLLCGTGIAQSVTLDVSKSADVKLMVALAVEKFGKLTILVNNAYGAPQGLSLGGSAVDLEEDGWDYAFSIGIKSHYLVGPCTSLLHPVVDAPAVVPFLWHH